MAGRSRVPLGYFTSAAAMDGGFFLIMAAMPFRVLDLGGGGLALGLVAAVGAVAYIVAAPLAGHWSDRLDRRVMALLGASSLVVCAVAAWLVTSVALLIGLQVLMGLGKALYWPPAQAAVGDLATASQRGRVLGRYNLSWSGGKAVGFVAGGLLLANYGFEAAYLAGAACVVLAAVMLPRGAVKAPDEAVDGPRRAPAEPRLPHGFLHMSWVANTAAYSAFGILTYHLPQYFVHQGWQADRYGWFFGAVLGTQTLVFLVLGLGRSVRWTRSRLWWPQLLSLVAVAAIPVWSGFVAFLATAPLVGLGCGICYQASITASLQEPSVRGRRAGIHEGLIGAGGFVPPLLAGMMVKLGLGVWSPYPLAAALLLIGLLIQISLRRRNP